MEDAQGKVIQSSNLNAMQWVFFLNGYKIEEPDRFMSKRENVGLKYCIFCAVIVLNFLENCLLIT